jgi:hypothetical protein
MPKWMPLLPDPDAPLDKAASYPPTPLSAPSTRSPPPLPSTQLASGVFSSLECASPELLYAYAKYLWASHAHAAAVTLLQQLLHRDHGPRLHATPNDAAHPPAPPPTPPRTPPEPTPDAPAAAPAGSGLASKSGSGSASKSGSGAGSKSGSGPGSKSGSRPGSGRAGGGRGCGVLVRSQPSWAQGGGEGGAWVGGSEAEMMGEIRAMGGAR